MSFSSFAKRESDREKNTLAVYFFIFFLSCRKLTPIHVANLSVSSYFTYVNHLAVFLFFIHIVNISTCCNFEHIILMLLLIYYIVLNPSHFIEQSNTACFPSLVSHSQESWQLFWLNGILIDI